MVFGVIIIVILGIGADILLTAWSFMALSAFLHANWWDAVPALDFSTAFFVGLLLGCISRGFSLTDSKVTVSSFIAGIGVGVTLLPFLLVWSIDILNNELIPAFPDLAYGTSLVFCLIGLGFAVVAAGMIALMAKIASDD